MKFTAKIVAPAGKVVLSLPTIVSITKHNGITSIDGGNVKVVIPSTNLSMVFDREIAVSADQWSTIVRLAIAAHGVIKDRASERARRPAMKRAWGGAVR
jgi:hypothetical protein